LFTAITLGGSCFSLGAVTFSPKTMRQEQSYRIVFGGNIFFIWILITFNSPIIDT